MGGLTQPPAKAASTFTENWFSEGSGKCLGALGGNMTNGTPVVQWTCNGHPDQMWEIQIVNSIPGGNWTQIQNAQDPSKCLGVLGSATSTVPIW
jgi:Ricin-type beta-trefoil lectin domain-like